MLFKFALVALAASALTGSVHAGVVSPSGSRPGSPSQGQSYTHLILAIQWSGGVCADGYTANRPVAGPSSQNICLRENKRNHWTIHGLWPANEYESPEFCSTEKFDGRVIDSLKSQLNQFWPSFSSPQDRYFTFWRHEWQKHGTCAGDVPQLKGLANFFKTVLNLFQQHDIKKYLDNSNVTPSKQKTYHPSQIVKAIADDFPHKFDVVCNQVQSANQPVLSEVRFCFDKNLRPVDCKGRYVRCGNQLYYPPSE